MKLTELKKWPRLYGRALYNRERDQIMAKCPPRDSENISESFAWSDTEEGHGFWALLSHMHSKFDLDAAKAMRPDLFVVEEPGSIEFEPGEQIKVIEPDAYANPGAVEPGKIIAFRNWADEEKTVARFNTSMSILGNAGVYLQYVCINHPVHKNLQFERLDEVMHPVRHAAVTVGVDLSSDKDKTVEAVVQDSKVLDATAARDNPDGLGRNTDYPERMADKPKSHLNDQQRQKTDALWAAMHYGREWPYG